MDHTQPNNAILENCHLPVGIKLARAPIDSLKKTVNIIFIVVIHSACKTTELTLSLSFTYCIRAKAGFLLNIFDANFNFINEHL